jgi:UDP-2-acetamido-3-amino-2,3-dideoxy-glucuronate N-acetyltransferase
MVGHITLYHPAIVRLAHAVAQGELGNIRYVYANRLNLGVVREEEDILWSFAPHDIAAFLGILNLWPETVAAHGGTYLKKGRADVTTTHMKFPGETRGHIFVSWLHPLKEHRLVVIGDLGMVVFEDRREGGTLLRYPPHPSLRGVPQQTPVPLAYDTEEPLVAEWKHFLQCLQDRREPITGSMHGLKVLRILEIARKSLLLDGEPLPCPHPEIP